MTLRIFFFFGSSPQSTAQHVPPTPPTPPLLVQTPFCSTSQRVVPRAKDLHPCLASCRSGDFGHRVGCAFADHSSILFLSPSRHERRRHHARVSARMPSSEVKRERERQREGEREKRERERARESERERKQNANRRVCPQHGSEATLRLHTPSSASLIQGNKNGPTRHWQGTLESKAMLPPFESQIGAELLPHMYLSNSLKEWSHRGRGAPTQPRRSWSCFCFRLRPRHRHQCLQRSCAPNLSRGASCSVADPLAFTEAAL